MSQRDNFAGGFILGSIVGGLVGGVLGVVLTNRARSAPALEADELEGEGTNLLDTEANIELARRRLEDKIAQLNGAIDEVRHQLGNVSSLGSEIKEEEHN